MPIFWMHSHEAGGSGNAFAFGRSEIARAGMKFALHTLPPIFEA